MNSFFYLIWDLNSFKPISMKLSLVTAIVLLLCIPASAQKADFKSAEKFRAENLTPKYGDLNVSANWIEDSDIF